MCHSSLTNIRAHQREGQIFQICLVIARIGRHRYVRSKKIDAAPPSDHEIGKVYGGWGLSRDNVALFLRGLIPFIDGSIYLSLKCHSSIVTRKRSALAEEQIVLQVAG